MTDIQIPGDLYGLVKIGARLDALASLMLEASEGLPESITVEDSKGVLELTMLRDGSVEDFQMESGWKEEIDPGDLGEAVNALLGEARTNLFEPIEEAISDQYEEMIDDDESFNILTDSFVEKIRAEAAANLDRSYNSFVPLQQALDDADSFMDRAYAAINDFESFVSGDEEPDFCEPVVCRRIGGKVISIHVNGNWARSAPYPTVQAEIRRGLTVDTDDYSTELLQELSSQGDVVFDQLIASMGRGGQN